MESYLKKILSSSTPLQVTEVTRVSTRLTPFGDARILIVEDGDAEGRILSNILSTIASIKGPSAKKEWLERHIQIYPDGREALAAFDSQHRSTPFGLVCLDNNIKGTLKGFQVAIELRQRGYHGPIILTTSALPHEFQWTVPLDSELHGLNLTTVSKSDTAYELTPVDPGLYKTITKRPIDAYYLPKPCSGPPLAQIIGHHFNLPPRDRVSPSLSSSTAPIPVGSAQQFYTDMTALISEVTPDLTTPGFQALLMQLNAKLQPYKVISYSLRSPSVDFGVIPLDGQDRHIFMTTIAQLTDVLTTGPAEDLGWVNRCQAIIDAASHTINGFKDGSGDAKTD